MIRHYEILKTSPLFAHIERDNLSAMLGCLGTKEMHYRKGETVFAEGDKASHMGIVCRGEVQMERMDYDGNRSLMAHLERGDLFAEAFAFSGIEKMPVHVVAAEATEVLLLEADRMLGDKLDITGIMSR